MADWPALILEERAVLNPDVGSQQGRRVQVGLQEKVVKGKRQVQCRTVPCNDRVFVLAFFGIQPGASVVSKLGKSDRENGTTYQ